MQTQTDYLRDAETSNVNAEPDIEVLLKSIDFPKWFSRSWTLQELVASRDIGFFNSRWEFIGHKNLVDVPNRATHIPRRVLEEGLDSKRASA